MASDNGRLMQITAEDWAAAGVSPARGMELAVALTSSSDATDAPQRWHQLAQHVLCRSDPFAAHQLVRDHVFADWDWGHGPPPLWQPATSSTSDSSAASNLEACLREWELPSFEALHAWSICDREAFWERTIQRLGIRFHRPPNQTLDRSNGVTAPDWLPGAQMNIAASCFQAPDDWVAVISGKPDGTRTSIHYGELRSMANRVAVSLQRCGLDLGAPVAVVMPMTVESVALYLGIVLAGGVVVSIADSFAPAEMATRLRIAQARCVFCTSSVLRLGKRIPLYDRVATATELPVIVLDHEDPAKAAGTQAIQLRSQDRIWGEFLDGTPDEPSFTPVYQSSQAPINVLFSSGTTGDPKAIPWDQTVPIRAAADGHYHQDIRPHDVVTWPTNLGWMMGPWLIFATLINRATIGLFEDAPAGRPFGEFVQNARVTILGVIPTIVRQWRQTECMKGLDWSALRLFSSTGECSSPEDMFYLMHLAGYRPVIEYCGGTEVGGAYLSSTVLHPHQPSTFTGPTLGTEVLLLDGDGQPTHSGEVFLVPPTIGFSTRLLQGDHDRVYYQDTPVGPAGQLLRRHGDHLERLPGGAWRALGRVDDTMNLAGIKVGSAEIERVLNRTPGVSETAAIALPAPDGGPSRLVVFTVRAPSGTAIPTEVPSTQDLLAAMNQQIKTQLNPLFRIDEVCVVDSLPRTASNKVLRRELRRVK